MPLSEEQMAALKDMGQIEKYKDAVTISDTTSKGAQWQDLSMDFFFSHAFLRTVAAVPVQEAYQLRAGSRRREAACEQCGATADLSEDLVQVRRLSRIAEVTPRRQLQEGGHIGAHGGDSEEAGPALDPAGTGSGPERRRQAGITVPREVAEEGGGFSTEPPANLDPDNDKTLPSRARKLGVRLAPLATSGGLDCRDRACGGARLRLAGPRNRTDGGCVNRELRPVPIGQAVRDDLNATRVAGRNIGVHVTEPDVACNARAALPADAGDCVLKWEGSGRQHTGRRTR